MVCQSLNTNSRSGKHSGSKVSERYSICCCDVKRKERSKNDAIETVKPVEINTKEPPKK